MFLLKLYQHAFIELSSPRLGVEVIDVEGLFLDLMREVSVKAQIEWDLVLDTDRNPGQGDWPNLLLLVKRIMPKLMEAVLANTGKTVLLTYPSLLGRYDQLSVLNDLQQEVGRKIKGLWLLLPGSSSAMIGRDSFTMSIISRPFSSRECSITALGTLPSGDCAARRITRKARLN